MFIRGDGATVTLLSESLVWRLREHDRDIQVSTVATATVETPEGDAIVAFFDDSEVASRWADTVRPSETPGFSPYRWGEHRAIYTEGRWGFVREFIDEFADEDGEIFAVRTLTVTWRSTWEEIAALARGEEVGDE